MAGMMSGLLTVKSGAQLAAEESAAVSALQSQRSTVASDLAAQITGSYNDARQFRQTIGLDKRLEDCQMSRRGEYDATTLAKIQARGGHDVFVKLVASKCGELEAWLSKAIMPPGEFPFSVSPTPLPELPESADEAVIARFDAKLNEAAMQAQMPPALPGAAQTPGLPPNATPGAPVAPPAAPFDPKTALLDAYDEELEARLDQARERSEAMEAQIQDQCTEGGFLLSLAEFLHYYATYPFAILKGPVISEDKDLKWVDGKCQIVPRQVIKFYAVNPANVFFAPNTSRAGNSPVIETGTITRAELVSKRGLPGWQNAAIDAIISGAQPSPVTMVESTQARLEDRTTSVSNGMAPNDLPTLEYWGPATGLQLAGLGLELGTSDPTTTHHITATMVGAEVVYAQLNADPLGKCPYFVSSIYKRPGTIYGEALPERISTEQRAVNACTRSLLDNLSLACGAQIAVDYSRIRPETAAKMDKMTPWMIWAYESAKFPAATGDPVKFFQPSSNAGELMQVLEYFDSMSDARTNIPRYAASGVGATQAKGALSTASGLSMMMEAAQRGLEGVVTNLDTDIITPAIKRLAVWNLLYNPNPRIKGDCQVLPRGASALLMKSQLQLRQQELFGLTSNPTDMQILAIEGRRKMLEKLFKAAGLNDIIPDEEELALRVQQQMQEQAAYAQAKMGIEQGGPPNG